MTKLKCWRQSTTDRNWWYVPQEAPTPTNPAKATLTIHQNKISKKFWIGKTGQNLSNYKKLKLTDTLKSARMFANKYMNKHNKC
mgnify:CR=1 FL=1